MVVEHCPSHVTIGTTTTMLAQAHCGVRSFAKRSAVVSPGLCDRTPERAFLATFASEIETISPLYCSINVSPRIGDF